jgi:hypothetical protein
MHSGGVVDVAGSFSRGFSVPGIARSQSSASSAGSTEKHEHYHYWDRGQLYHDMVNSRAARKTVHDIMRRPRP